ncbi:MAG TPA: GNAT family N-acetyltransferase [Candidatus Angelobacter sp.]
MNQRRSVIEYRIEPLGNRHQRNAFSCGVQALDRYLQRQAAQDISKRVAAVFVLTPDGETIAGYCTLSAHVVNLPDLPENVAKKLSRYPKVPATLLGRLAVNTNFRGQGIGELLLLDAFRRVLASTREIASAMIVVDAKDENARNFYLHHDFVPLPTQPNRLFYTVKAIEKLFVIS